MNQPARIQVVLLVLITLLSYTSYAQPSFPPPTGVYCSCGPTTGNGLGSVHPSIASKPFVSGILVRVGWDILEPADDVYNWSLIDTQLNRAKAYGKKVSLGIGSGIVIPQWVFDGGAQRLVSSSPKNDTLAVPWDAYYLTKWKEFISALGSRYKNDTVIQMVYITHSTANGFEMQLPRTSTPTLSAVGYTDKKMSDSWKEVIDAFNAAFPNHYLSNDFHPVNGSNAVADTVYEYAVNTIGSRYGAAAWWWTQKNTTVYPGQYDILKSSVGSSFGIVQFARNGTTDSALFGAGGMPGAMDLAVRDGVCYWEIWNEDILNPKFDSLLNNAKCSSVSVKSIVKENEQPFKVYPNPTKGIFTVEHDRLIEEIQVYDQVMRRVYLSKPDTGKIVRMNLQHLQRGVYVFVVKDAEGTYYRKLILD